AARVHAVLEDRGHQRCGRVEAFLQLNGAKCSAGADRITNRGGEKPPTDAAEPGGQHRGCVPFLVTGRAEAPFRRYLPVSGRTAVVTNARKSSTAMPSAVRSEGSNREPGRC